MATAESTAPPAGGRSAGQGSRSGSRLAVGLGVAVVGLVALMFLSLAVGAKPISLPTVWDALFHYGETDDQVVIVRLRVPRTLLGVLAGAALGLAGALMQALSRNPLADPGILGVNSGAALAVVVAISFLHIDTLNGYVWFALAGAGVATVVVYLLGSAGRAGPNPARLALAGAAVSAVLSGLISAIVLVDIDAFDGFRAWSVGSLAGRDLSVAAQVLPFVMVGLLVGLLMARSLNALALGDEMAMVLGARVAWIRLTGVLATTLMCGAATAAVGPIGFVGLVVPHAVRAVTGADYRWLLPYSTVLGAVLLVAADIVGRVVARPGELETAIVTAAVGTPVFIILVRRRRLAQL